MAVHQWFQTGLWDDRSVITSAVAVGVEEVALRRVRGRSARLDQQMSSGVDCQGCYTTPFSFWKYLHPVLSSKCSIGGNGCCFHWVVQSHYTLQYSNVYRFAKHSPCFPAVALEGSFRQPSGNFPFGLDSYAGITMCRCIVSGPMYVVLGLEVERDADGFSIASDALDEATSISSDASEVVEDDSEQIKSPEEVARRCTDSGCVWLWAACLASFAVCILLGTLQEERHQFVRLTNKRGTQCGVFDQKGKEFWFLCTANESSFADSIATCVPNCAMGSDLNSYCEDAAFAEDATLGGNSTPSNNYTYLARQAGPLCVPVHAGRASSFRRQLVERGFLSIDMFLTAESSWPPLVFAAVLSVAISHSWIRVLRDHAGTLAWVGVYLLVVFPIGVLAYEWLQSGYVSSISMTLTAVVVCCISCLACRSQENLDRATLYLNAACQCVGCRVSARGAASH